MEHSSFWDEKLRVPCTIKDEHQILETCGLTLQSISTLFPLFRIYIKLMLDVLMNFHQFIIFLLGLNSPFLCDLYFLNCFIKSDDNDDTPPFHHKPPVKTKNYRMTEMQRTGIRIPKCQYL